MSRLEDLTSTYLKILNQACDRCGIMEFNTLCEHSGQSPQHFEAQFKEFMQGKSLRMIAQILSQMHLSEQLNILDLAEQRAMEIYDKQRENLPLAPNEMPVNLYKLDITDLVDLRTRSVRDEWNNSLIERLERANREISELDEEIEGLELDIDKELKRTQ